MIINKLKEQNAFISIWVLIFFSISLYIFFNLFHKVEYEIKINNIKAKGIYTQYICEAGANIAIENLKKDNNWGIGVTQIIKINDTESCEVVVEETEKLNERKISSIARIQDVSKKVQVLIQLPITTPSLYEYVIFSNYTLEIISSEISGKLGSQFNIQIDRSYIDGDVESTKSIYFINGSRITAGHYLKAPPLYKINFPQFISFNKNLIYDTKTKLFDKEAWLTSLKDKEIIFINGNLYLGGENNSEYLLIYATGNIYLEKNTEISGSCLLIADGEINILESNLANCTLIANRKITIDKSSLNGNIIGKDSINIKNNSKLIFYAGNTIYWQNKGYIPQIKNEKNFEVLKWTF